MRLIALLILRPVTSRKIRSMVVSFRRAMQHRTVESYTLKGRRTKPILISSPTLAPYVREPVENKTGALPKARPSWVVGRLVFHRSNVSVGVTSPCPLVRAVMLHKGQESSSPRLVWVERQSVTAWGCSECAWVFNLPAGLPTGISLDEMKRNFQMQLSEEFASHACAKRPRVKGAKLSS
jgi:hypothetical protein